MFLPKLEHFYLFKFYFSWKHESTLLGVWWLKAAPAAIINSSPEIVVARAISAHLTQQTGKLLLLQCAGLSN